MSVNELTQEEDKVLRTGNPHRSLAAGKEQRREPKMKRIARSVIGLMVLLGAGAAGDARAQVCTNTPLPEVSAAVIPANGFPLYYDDANGLALTPCLDPAAAGFCGGVAGVPVPNPAAAIAFPG